jgi:tRNA pseudouridine38-40 synthase
MARYRAVVEYDGTDFRGFQRQAEGRTVQGDFEAALTRLGWPGATIWGAGRTDSGVHAVGQVVAFDLDWAHGGPALQRALNANLPDDIAVQAVAESPPAFHPRFDARARRYRYTIYQGLARSPLRARYAWHVQTPLDGPAMQAAAERLLGTHDFATFGTDPDGGANTVRTVSRAVWSGGRLPLPDGAQPGGNSETGRGRQFDPERPGGPPPGARPGALPAAGAGVRPVLDGSSLLRRGSERAKDLRH